MRWTTATLLFVCGLGGCRAGTGGPTRAVRTMLDAALAGDVQAVWQLLGPRTRERLENDAERAGMQAGRRHVAPQDLLAVGWSLPQFAVEDVREVERSADQAVVEVSGGKERARVELLREPDGWKVELP